MSASADSSSRFLKLAGTWFERIEHGFYLVTGVLVCIAAAIACVGAILVMIQSLPHPENGGYVVDLIDRLLFVLMLVEILHTVHQSLRTGSLRPEPFLVVGLIASIRRLLVITLQSSAEVQEKTWSDKTEALFRAHMTELGVLAVLIMVLVVSLYLIRRGRANSEA